VAGSCEHAPEGVAVAPLGGWGTRPRREVCVNCATVRPVRRLTLQAVVTVWPACPGTARTVPRLPHPSRRSRSTVSAPPSGALRRLSWKFRLSRKLLAAMVALFFRVSHMFHDIVTLVDYRCEMVFRVTAAHPPLGRGHPAPVDGAWGMRTPSGPRDLREKRQLTRKSR
jgi:hypothetical protein